MKIYSANNKVYKSLLVKGQDVINYKIIRSYGTFQADNVRKQIDMLVMLKDFPNSIDLIDSCEFQETDYSFGHPVESTVHILQIESCSQSFKEHIRQLAKEGKLNDFTILRLVSRLLNIINSLNHDKNVFLLKSKLKQFMICGKSWKIVDLSYAHISLDKKQQANLAVLEAARFLDSTYKTLKSVCQSSFILDDLYRNLQEFKNQANSVIEKGIDAPLNFEPKTLFEFSLSLIPLNLSFALSPQKNNFLDLKTTI